MTQFDQDPYSDEFQPVEKQSNPLGIVGFVLSVLCLTSPIGLIVSVIALFRNPKGFAIAGTIIGVIFSAILGLVAVAGVQIGPFAINTVSLGMDAGTISREMADYQSENQSFPDSLDQLELSDTKDPWDNEYVLTVDEQAGTWTVRSLGPDGQPDTDDDFVFDSTMEPSDVSQAVSEWANEIGEEKYGN